MFSLIETDWQLEIFSYFIFSKLLPSPFCMMRRPLAYKYYFSIRDHFLPASLTSLLAWASTARLLTISRATERFLTSTLSTDTPQGSQAVRKVFITVLAISSLIQGGTGSVSEKYDANFPVRLRFCGKSMWMPGTKSNFYAKLNLNVYLKLSGKAGRRDSGVK